MILVPGSSFPPSYSPITVSASPSTFTTEPTAGQMLSLGGNLVATWAPDGKHLLTWIVDGTEISVFDASGAKVRQIKGSAADWLDSNSVVAWTATGPVVQGIRNGSVAISIGNRPGDSFSGAGGVAVGTGPSSSSPTFEVWDAGSMSGPSAGVPVGWSRDGTRLAVWHPTAERSAVELTGWLEVLEYPKLDRVAAANSYLTSVQPPEFSPDGQQLAFISRGRLTVLDLRTDNVSAATNEPLASDMFAWDAAEHLIYAASDGSVKDVSPGGGAPTVIGQGDTVTGSADGSTIVFYSPQDALQGQISVLRGGSLSTISAPGPIEPALAVAPDGTSLVAICATQGQMAAVLLPAP